MRREETIHSDIREQWYVCEWYANAHAQQEERARYAAMRLTVPSQAQTRFNQMHFVPPTAILCIDTIVEANKADLKKIKQKLGDKLRLSWYCEISYGSPEMKKAL